MLPAWAARMLEELDASDRQASAVARELSLEQLNWSPAPGQWSVGQCLDHLLMANQVYLPPMARALDGRPHAPVQEITPGWFGRWFIRTQIDPSTQRRRGRAPGKITPAQHVDPSVLDQFVRSNDTVRDLVGRASAHDVNRIRFVNPFVPLVRFTVGTGLEIVWKHQRRHLLQAERVRRSHGFPG
jgi:DinB superfamily